MGAADDTVVLSERHSNQNNPELTSMADLYENNGGMNGASRRE